MSTTAYCLLSAGYFVVGTIALVIAEEFFNTDDGLQYITGLLWPVFVPFVLMKLLSFLVRIPIVRLHDRFAGRNYR